MPSDPVDPETCFCTIYSIFLSVFGICFSLFGIPFLFGTDDGDKTAAWIIYGVAVPILLVATFCCCYCCHRRKKGLRKQYGHVKEYRPTTNCGQISLPSQLNNISVIDHQNISIEMQLNQKHEMRLAQYTNIAYKVEPQVKTCYRLNFKSLFVNYLFF